MRGTKCNTARRKFSKSSDVFSLLLANPATKLFRNSNIVSCDNRESVYVIIFKSGQTRTEYERVKLGYCHFLAIVHQHRAHGQESQINTLIYAMGDQADDILNSFNLTSAQLKQFHTVKTRFDEHFLVRQNVIFEQAKFNRCRQ